MQFTQIKETCLYVADLRKTREFYEKTLGLPVIGFQEGRHIFFRAGTSVLLCFISESVKNDPVLPGHYGSGYIHLAFEINASEYETSKNELKNKGISIIHEHKWPNNRLSYYFRDPDGHLLEVVQPGMWESIERK